MAIVTDSAGIRQILERIKRIAVLGIKMEAWQPAFYVPEYAQSAGFEIVPVPVYYPDVTEILGQQVYRRVADVPPPVDLVNVFRRSEKMPEHLDDLLTAKPPVVWMQSGIRHDGVAQTLSEHGIDVVQDRCLMVEMRKAGM